MNRRLFLAALFPFVAVLAAASAKGWILLGERTVSDRADHDVIAVTRSEGTFRQIKLTVQRHPVDFHKVVVHFGNGQDQEVSMRGTVRAGGETRAIDLEGTERVIKTVEFWYDANSRGRQAVVRLLGKE